MSTDVGKTAHVRVSSAAGQIIILDKADAMSSARSFINRYATCRASGMRTLHYYQGEFFFWELGGYRGLTESEVLAAIWHFLAAAHLDDGKPFKPSQHHVSNVLAALKAICPLPSESSPPTWLSKTPQSLAQILTSQILPLANGLLHVPSGNLHLPTPGYFGISTSKVKFEESARADRWFQFLYEIFGDDHESRDALQDWFGYFLTPDTSQQKILLMVGVPRSGKGTTARVITELLGRRSVASLTVANLWESFGLQSVIGKPLAIIPDARFTTRHDPAAVAERLLSISGEDAVSINRKYLPVATVQLPTRFMIMTNELPNLRDSSGAVVGRFIVLKLSKSFVGKEDPLLFDRLKGELPGILNWAIEGYHRLHGRGNFQQPQSSLDTILAMKEISSPVTAFVEDECQVGPNLSVSKKRLFEQWNVWGSQNGYRPGDQQAFGRELRAAFPNIGEVRPRGGSRQRLYTGIGLRSDGLAVIEGGRAHTNEAEDAPPQIGGGPHGPYGPQT